MADAYGTGFGSALARGGRGMFETMFQIMQSQQSAERNKKLAEQKTQGEELQKILTILPHLKDMQDFPEVIAGITLRLKDLGINIGDIDVEGVRRTSKLGQVRRDYFKMLELVKAPDTPGYLKDQALNYIAWARDNYPELGYKTSTQIFQEQDPRDVAVMRELTGEEGRIQAYREKSEALIKELSKTLGHEQATAIVNRFMQTTEPKTAGAHMQARDIESRELDQARGLKAAAEATGVGKMDPGYRAAVNRFNTLGGEIEAMGAHVKKDTKWLKLLDEYRTSKDRKLTTATWGQDPDALELIDHITSFGGNVLGLRERIEARLFETRGKLTSAWERHAHLLRTYPELKQYSNMEEPRQPQKTIPAPGGGGGFTNPLAPTPSPQNKPQGSKAPANPQGPQQPQASAPPPGAPKATTKPTATPKPPTGLAWQSPVGGLLKQGFKSQQKFWRAEYKLAHPEKPLPPIGKKKPVPSLTAINQQR